MTRQTVYRDLARSYGYLARIWAAGLQQGDDYHIYAVTAAHFGRLALGQTFHSVSGIEAWDELRRNEWPTGY